MRSGRKRWKSIGDSTPGEYYERVQRSRYFAEQREKRTNLFKLSFGQLKRVLVNKVLSLDDLNYHYSSQKKQKKIRDRAASHDLRKYFKWQI